MCSSRAQFAIFNVASDKDERFATKASNTRVLLKVECTVAGSPKDFCGEAED
jgi:hypothetical protein